MNGHPFVAQPMPPHPPTPEQQKRMYDLSCWYRASYRRCYVLGMPMELQPLRFQIHNAIVDFHMQQEMAKFDPIQKPFIEKEQSS